MVGLRTCTVVATVLVAIGCNEVFGIDDVPLLDDTTPATGTGAAVGGTGASGGNGATGGTGGEGGEGGGGGGGGELYACEDEIGFESGLILRGDFDDEDDWGGSNVTNFQSDDLGACEGAYFMDLWANTGGPPAGGYIWSDGAAGPLTAGDECLSWRIAARRPGSAPRFWLFFNFGELEDVDSVVNLLTPADGIEPDNVTWEFYTGVCKVNLPATTGGVVDVRVYVDGALQLDAFEAHAVRCTPEIDDCAGL